MVIKKILFQVLLIFLFLTGCVNETKNISYRTDIVEETNECSAVDKNDEELTDYALELSDFYIDNLQCLSRSAFYYYNEKLYIDYVEIDGGPWLEEGSSKNSRLIFGKKDDRIVLLEKKELSSMWDRESMAGNGYIVSGDCKNQRLQIDDLNNEKTQYILCNSDQKIASWCVQGNRLYYAVIENNIIKRKQYFTVYCRKLGSDTDMVLYTDQQIDWVCMSVNEEGTVGLLYDTNIPDDKRHISIIKDKKLIEIDTKNIERINNEIIMFKFIGNKFMINTDDIKRDLEPSVACYTIDLMGNLKYINCDGEILSFFGDIPYFDDSYVIWRDGVAKAYNMEGKKKGETEYRQSENNLKEYLIYSNNNIYIISIRGQNSEIEIQVSDIKL